MPADVVNGYERHPEAEGQALGEVHADKQRAYQPGRVCDRDGVYVRAREARHGESAVGELVYDLDVAARGNLGHDAAVDRVEVGLGENLVGQHLPAVAHEGDGGLIAGGFNGKNNHDCASFR